MTQTRKYGLWLALLATVLIGGCGIKPSSLEPPEGSPDRPFPSAYPKPEAK